jgi:hypothetical protein
MVSSPPAGPPAAPDDREPDASERVDLSKREPAPAEVDPPIWAIGPTAAGGPPAGGPHPPVAGIHPNGAVPTDAAPYDAPPPDWVPVVDETQYRATPRDLGLEIATALAVAVLLTGLGAGLAYLWAAISPRVVLEMTADGPAYVEPNPEGYVAGESVFLLMTVGVGILSAVAVWMLARKRRGPIVLAGLAIGSVVGATLMAWLGHRIGLSEYQRLLENPPPVGTRFEVPVRVRSAQINLNPVEFEVQGAILVQAMLAVAVYTLLAGFYPTVSLRPERALVRFVPPGGYWDGAEPYAGESPEDQAKDADVSSDSPAPSDPRAAQAPPAGG